MLVMLLMVSISSEHLERMSTKAQECHQSRRGCHRWCCYSGRHFEGQRPNLSIDWTMKKIKTITGTITDEEEWYGEEDKSDDYHESVMEAEMEWDISHPTLFSTPPRFKFYSQIKDNEKDKDNYGEEDIYNRCEEKGYPCIFKVPFELTGAKAYAEKSLEYYNKKNGTNYKHFCSLLCKNFSGDRNRGSWVHCNFSAKQDVDGKPSCKIFFAEILLDRNDRSMKETLTITACLLLEGITTAGCNLCSNVLHPANGFLKGQNKPRRSTSPTSSSSPPYSPSSPASPSSPMSPDFSGKENPVSVELRRQADIALEHFNKGNGTNYKLVDVLDGNNIYWEGYWFHFNFTANSPKDDIDGESSSKLFFAENFAVIAETVTWTANACHLLDGKTTDGCAFCSGIIHPTHGFSQGSSRAQMNKCPAQSNTVPRDLPSNEKHCRRAEIAIEFYNHNNNSDYEVVEVFLSNGFLSDGTWYHFNFEAKHDVDGKYTSKIFFAELFADNNHPTTETLTVTACQILNAGETTSCCGFCSNVIHPSQGGFLKLVLE